MEPKITVIVPCYNASAFLSSTIESVVNQNTLEWELLLIDDGSKDSTWQIISDFTARDSRIKGFRNENQGTTKTRNYGFSKASAESLYVFFLDHDDQLVPESLQQMSMYLDLHPEVGLLGCQYRDVSADGELLETGKVDRWAPGLFFPQKLRPQQVETPFETFFCATGQGPFAMYRKSVYLLTEGWDNNFWPHEDSDMFCQMALLGPVHYLPDRLYLKRIHPAQGMNNSGRVNQSYFAFRTKWDNRIPKNIIEAQMLERAKRYYYTMHAPCRDLKVGSIAFKELLHDPSLRRAKWFITLMLSSITGLTLNRLKSHKLAK
jgi:glycosyltransferase involved in cell wall biosynthesis